MNNAMIITVISCLFVGYLCGVVHQVARQKRISKLEKQLVIERNKGLNAIECAKYFYNENKRYQPINRPYDYALDA